MKYKFTALMGMLLMGFGMTAQSASIDSVKALYSELPGWLYPSQLLHNRSPYYLWSFSVDSNQQWQLNPDYKSSPYHYPGTIPSNLITTGDWIGVYSDMWHSSTNPALIPGTQALNTADSIARLVYEVPIGAMHLNFHRILPAAVENGYLFYNDTLRKLTVLPDTLWLDKDNGVYQYYSNPDSLAELAFQGYEVFAGVLPNSLLYKEDSVYTVTFGLASSLFFENQVDQITYIEIDFDNGDGFLPVQFDVPKVITYSDGSLGPEEDFEKQLRLRLHYGSKVVETTMPLVIVPNTPVADEIIYASSFPFECQVATNGFTPGQAKVSIRYGNAQKKLLKPILLVEGFEGTLEPYGLITYNGLASGFIWDETNNERVYQHMAKLKLALDSLHTLGYDIVYIDNKNGRDWIQANALNTIKTIQWINKKVAENGSHEKLVVIGASMGGLIVRYALAKMEADGCCHNTRLYGTFDSPHNGAHIPLGLQATVKHLHDELGWVDNLFTKDKVRPSWAQVLNSPAARQMLVSHLDPTAAQTRAAFMAEFDSLGHPQQCRQIAIVNGSEQALPNTIADGWKTFILCQPNLWLPIHHFTGVTWQPPANIIGITIPYYKMVMNSFSESRSDGVVFQANEFATASKIASVILLEHGLSAGLQNAALVIKFLLPTLAVPCDALITTCQTISNIALPALHVLNAITNLTPSPPIQYVANTDNYSEAPGSTTNTPRGIAKALPGLATMITEDHSFIQSISALDVDTNDLYLNIKNVRIPLEVMGKIPFDSYWAPGRGDRNDANMKHIEVTPELYRWLIEQIDLNDELRDPATGAYTKTLTGYYNFGKPSVQDAPFLKHLYSVDVVNGGVLFINHNGVIGYPGGDYFTASNSSFACYTGKNCEAPHIRIGGGGLFEVGQATTNNYGRMYFEENSKLEILTGGTLRIDEGSILVIEPGSELILHPGATINLSGPNAVLELQGKVTLKPGASLSPTGTGILRLAQSAPDAVSFATLWDCQGSNALKVTGQGRRVEVVHKAYLPAGLDSVVFSGVETAIYPGVALHVMSSPVRFSFSRFTCADTTDKHQGVFLYGQGVIGEHSVFKFGYYGLSDNLTLGTGALTLSGCRFTQNMIGLGTRDGQVDLFACRFFDNDASGWLAEDVQGNCRVEACEFLSHPVSGMTFSSQAGVLLEVSESEFKYNTNGLEVDVASVRATCSIFSYNTTAGIVSRAGSTLYLNEEATNVFNGNQHALALVNGNIPKLRNGKNNFSGSAWYATGTVPDCNCSWAMDVSQNVMPATSTPSGPSLPINLTYTQLPSTAATVTPTNWTAMNSLGLNTACENMTGMVSGNSLAASMFDELTTGRVVNTPLYPNWWLEEALADAAYKVSSTQQVFDDLNAIARFNEVLASLEAPFNEQEQSAVTTAMDLMLMALGNAYDQGLIPLNGGELENPESPYLALVTEQFDQQLGQLGLSGEEFFHANLALAQAYRMAEHFDYALEVLNSQVEPLTIQELAATEYWACVCQAESDLLQENISPEDFQVMIQDCQSTLESSKMAFNLVPGYTLIGGEAVGGELVASLYPNPATDRVHIDLVNHRGETTVHLIDARGVIVRSETFTEAEPIDLDVRGLAAGLYLVRVKQADRVEHVKLSILE